MEVSKELAASQSMTTSLPQRIEVFQYKKWLLCLQDRNERGYRRRDGQTVNQLEKVHATETHV